MPEASLQVESLSPAETLVRSDLLGVIAPPLDFAALPVADDLPLLRINAACLASSHDATCEVLLSRQSIRHGRSPLVAGGRAINYRCTDDFIFGVIEVDESAFTLEGERTPLLQAAEAGYRGIFRLLEDLGYSTLLRAWNYIGGINVESHGIERYRQFNIGRQNAFVSDGRAITGNVPAACALGVNDGPLQLAFLGSRQAMRAIENPRQVSAYNYPSQYGPRSPTFSRAALFNTAHDEILFISGTASIIGHQSVHPGDIVAQVAESLVNVSILLDQANKVRHAHLPCTLADVSYRVYVRNVSDLDAIRQEFERIVGTEAVAVYLQSDVCRSDLLVEIEGSAMLARTFEP
jgi:chorismate lyase/3-hydroxybenzoate synthase